MITDFIIGAFVSGIGALLDLVPVISIPSPGENFASFTGVIGGANKVFPVFWAMGGITAIVVLKIALNVWDLIVWVYHQFWGSD